MKYLPLGYSSLGKIVKNNCIYVDKTKYILDIIRSGTYYFLSRPRRFGKTLTLDTLKCIFEGRKELFKGLYIYDRWNWEERYPVLKIDFSQITAPEKSRIELNLRNYLFDEEKRLELGDCRREELPFYFRDIIIKAKKKYGKNVVVLIDEYDKPILDNIEKPSLAEEIRDFLSNFYGILKGLDEHLRFVFLTGVSKFSKVNLFSKLNNLEDITLDENYSTLCGYTEDEIKEYFKEHLKGADMEKMRRWYNGYSWLGESVYNPYDILLFIKKGFRFHPYWFETGTPTFLLKLIKERKYFVPDLERIEATDTILGSFDVYTIEIESLLWQTGYLTIKGTRQLGERTRYLLSYPNMEVKISLSEYILTYLSNIGVSDYSNTSSGVYEAFLKGDVEKLISEFKRLFSSIPYTNFTRNELEGYEGFYGSVIYSFLASLGVEVIAEDITNKGRIDLTVLVENKAYIFEFKVGKDAVDAFKQIKERRYFEKYGDRETFLIGISFDKEKRNIGEYRWEKV